MKLDTHNSISPSNRKGMNNSGLGSWVVLDAKILALRRLKQKNNEFKARLGYLANS